MQEELASERPELAIRLLAVNEAGFESGQASMADLGDLPLLQDTATVGAWASWMVDYRDVIIVDEDGIAVYVYNLTSNDLSDTANYDTLKDALVAVAEGSAPTP